MLRQALAGWPPGGLLLALSGGPDSSALLHALAAEPQARARGLRALHVDHSLHPDSADWARHAQASCAIAGVELQVVPVEVRARGAGLEAAAREARYAALRDAQGDGELVLTAHHADDQAETLLWRLLRGAGPQGLAAMRPLRRFGRGWLARPWLALPRAAIRAYLDGHAVASIDDPANVDPRHDRAFLRHAVLPLLHSRWPQAAAGLARSAAMLDHGARQLRADARRLLAHGCGPDPATLRWAALAAATPVLRGAVLRQWLLGLGLAPPGATALAAIEHELLAARRDAKPCVRWPGAELRRHRELLHAMAPLARTPPGYALDWDGRGPLPLPGELGSLVLDDAPAGLALQVRPRRGGERIRPQAGGPNRELKHVLQELGLPPWLRARLPLVWRGDLLLAAGDIASDHTLRASGARLRWLPHAPATTD
jgi:tRNA(Ile)-lysidine synthase